MCKNLGVGGRKEGAKRVPKMETRTGMVAGGRPWPN
jgi:hypothetical protein